MIPAPYSTSFIEQAAAYFIKYPTKKNDAYADYLCAQGLDCSIADQYSFYEKVLRAQSKWDTLACLYAKSGRLDEAIETAKKSGDPYLAAIFYVRKGDIANAQILKEKPAEACSYSHLVGWIKFHELNGTLESAITGFEHVLPYFNGLISLARCDYASAIQEFYNCPPAFKIYLAYAYAQSSQFDKTQSEYDVWFKERDSQNLCFLDEFELWQTVFPRVSSFNINSFGLGYNFFSKDKETVNTLFSSLKDRHNTPILSLYYQLINDSPPVVLENLLQLQNDAPFNDIDRLVFAYCREKNKLGMLIEYCEKREQKTNAWQFSNKWAETQSLVSSNLSAATLSKMEALADESSRKERPPFIQKFLAIHYGANGQSKKAKNLFNEHTRFYGHTTDVVLGLHACPSDTSELYITVSAVYNKDPRILDIVYEYVKNKPVGQIDFSNQAYHAGFRKKVETLGKREKDSDTEKALEELELNALTPGAALKVLKEKKPKNHLDYFLFSYFLFLEDKKAPALFDLKRVEFDKIPLEQLIRTFKKMAECHVSFLIFAVKYLPVQGKLTLAEKYISLKKYDDANGLISGILREQPENNYASHLKVMCLLGMKKPLMAKRFIEDYPEYQLSPLLAMVEAAMQTESTASPAPAAASQKPSIKPPTSSGNPLMTGFTLEKPRTKEERIEKVVRHNFGGTKQKGGVDPIQHASGFDPKKYKPKEDEPVQIRTENKKAVKAVKPVEALVENKISAHYRKTLEHARTLLLKAHLSKELFDKNEINEAALRNNLLFTYLRVFEIISFKTINSELLNSLQNRRVETRHHFILIPSANAINCFQYLSEIKLEAQLFNWIQGSGTINHLALSPIQLIDNELKAKWDALNQIQKDNERIKTIKTELNNLQFFMQHVKTEGVLAGDGPYENAAKMSIIMIGMCWSQLRASEKNKLAPYFRPYKLDGNLGAHQFKHDTEQGHIKFMHMFEDISIENMWKFAQDTPKLISYLEKDFK